MSKLNFSELKDFLDAKVVQYNTPEFIGSDPLQIPHRYTLKEDIEISGFLTATIAWGNRKSIINNANRLMRLMDDAPFEFVMQHQENDLEVLKPFVHRTFNGLDCIQFIESLKHIYTNYNGLEAVFNTYAKAASLQSAIHHLKQHFFEIDHLKRTQKHISDPLKNSAAKRINMFLRWMVRDSDTGVDFGIWNTLQPAQLLMPLDVHVDRVGRKLKLIKRKQRDFPTVLELTKALKKFDPQDPVKYDFALFGVGVMEN